MQAPRPKIWHFGISHPDRKVVGALVVAPSKDLAAAFLNTVLNDVEPGHPIQVTFGWPQFGVTIEYTGQGDLPDGVMELYVRNPRGRPRRWVNSRPGWDEAEYPVPAQGPVQ